MLGQVDAAPGRWVLGPGAGSTDHTHLCSQWGTWDRMNSLYGQPL